MNTIESAYARRELRASTSTVDDYAPTLAWVTQARQEYERGLVEILRPLEPLRERTLLEVGCGHGTNLLNMIALGFEPKHVAGFDLLPERVTNATFRVPSQTFIWRSDAATLELDDPFDIVLQSTVLSSILDRGTRERVAANMWAWTKPGGRIISYDLAIDNPHNKDVMAVPAEEIRRLFPNGKIRMWKILAVPPSLKPWQRWLLSFGLVRACAKLVGIQTHLLCEIVKPV